MAHLQKSKNKDFRGVIVTIKTVRFLLRGAVKLCFEDIGHGNLTANKFTLVLVWFIYGVGLNNLHSNFCKDPRTFACFGTIRDKCACLIIKTLTHPNIYSMHIDSP